MNGSQEALRQACAIAGLDPDDARLLRLGSNAVYRLRASIVARISRPGADIDHVRRTVAVAFWLESANYPAVRLAEVDADQPIVKDGYIATFWQALSDNGDQYASTPEIAEVLRKLHQLDAPAELHLPPLAPFANAAQRIDANTWLTPEDRDFLTATLAKLQAAYNSLEFVLPPGVIHGDASVGNVLRDTHGTPVLIDLDGFAIGPREWDLALTAIYYDSFGWHTREEYEDFARVYSYDIMQLARLPGHAIRPRVPHGHLGHPESP